MRYEYTLMPSPVGELTLVARAGKLSAILWEQERANRVRLGPLHEANDNPVLLETQRQLRNISPVAATGSNWNWTSPAPRFSSKSGKPC
jgi:hypothetical protein